VFPGANEENVIASGLDVTAIVIAAELVWSGEPLSFTDAVKVDVAPETGVPEITPAGESESPLGN
jgi:hypothetical protein